jgi:hypothetical protein
LVAGRSRLWTIGNKKAEKQIPRRLESRLAMTSQQARIAANRAEGQSRWVWKKKTIAKTNETAGAQRRLGPRVPRGREIRADFTDKVAVPYGACTGDAGGTRASAATGNSCQARWPSEPGIGSRLKAPNTRLQAANGRATCQHSNASKRFASGPARHTRRFCARDPASRTI